MSQDFIDFLEKAGADVTVLGYARPGHGRDLAPHVTVIDERPIETHQSGSKALIWYGLSLLKNAPYSSAKYHSTQYVETIQALLRQQTFDIVVIDHAQMGFLLPCFPKSQPLVFIAHNVEGDLYRELAQKKSLLKRLPFVREASLMARMERQLLGRAQSTWTLTAEDAQTFQTKYGATQIQPFIIPGPSPTERTPSLLPTLQEPVRYDIGILGTWSWQPNAEGLQWFMAQVLPHLPSTLRIGLAGRGADWANGVDSRVDYVGFVESPQQFFEQCQMIAIPSIAGGGIQIKTLEAISFGKPLVATPTALRGLGHWPDYVQVADTPDEFATALVHQLALPADPTASQKASHWLKQRHDNFLVEIHSQLAMLCDKPFAETKPPLQIV